MAQIEMVIDFVRRNMLSDMWVIILKEKGAERYLPIYAGSPQASLVGRQLQGVYEVYSVPLRGLPKRG